MASRKRLLISLGILVLIVGLGVTGYMVIDRDATFLQAMYMVIITLSTVGYRDDMVADTPIVHAWTIGVIVFGVVAATIVISSMVGLVVPVSYTHLTLPTN